MKKFSCVHLNSHIPTGRMTDRERNSSSGGSVRQTSKESYWAVISLGLENFSFCEFFERMGWYEKSCRLWANADAVAIDRNEVQTSERASVRAGERGACLLAIGTYHSSLAIGDQRSVSPPFPSDIFQMCGSIVLIGWHAVLHDEGVHVSTTTCPRIVLTVHCTLCVPLHLPQTTQQQEEKP
jgi:hypothetical protein